MKIDQLTAMVAAVCPIISINSNGVVVYDPSATAAQKTSAQGVISTNLPLLAPTSLSVAQDIQIGLLTKAYNNAIQQPVSFTTKAGITKTFQADPQSQQNLSYVMQGFTAAAVTPTGFYWVAADNTQVAFAFADLQGLAAAMVAQGWTAFQHLQTQKAAVNTATTVAAVQTIIW